MRTILFFFVLTVAGPAQAGALVPPGGHEVLLPALDQLSVTRGEPVSPGATAPFSGHRLWILVGPEGAAVPSTDPLCQDARARIEEELGPRPVAETGCVLSVRGPLASGDAAVSHWAGRRFLASGDRYWIVLPGDWAEAPPTAGDDLAELEEDDLTDLVASWPQMAYPPAAKELGIEGTLRVKILVDEQGQVVKRKNPRCRWNDLSRKERRRTRFHFLKCVEVVSGPMDFEIEVLSAWAFQAVFRPYVGPDGPSAYIAVVDVVFKLR